MSEPRRIQELLEGALSRLGIADSIRERRVLSRWTEIVGPHVARASRPLRFEKGILWVGVKSHAWAQELQWQAQTILDRLNEKAQKKIFQVIRFVIRPSLPEASFQATSEQTVSLAVLISSQSLEETDRKALEQSVQSIGEPLLRDAFWRARAAFLKASRWKFEQGWRPCRGCGALYNEPESLCWLCRERS